MSGSTRTSAVSPMLVLLLLTSMTPTTSTRSPQPPPSSAATDPTRPPPDRTPPVSVEVTGDPVRVWGSLDAWRQCGIGDFPDIPTRAFAIPTTGSTNNNYTVHLIQGSTNAHLMTGSSLFNVTRSCNATWNMTGDPDPARFAGDEFLDSTWVFENGTVISLSHTEYPGNRFDNCPGPAYPYCWTVTLGLMISHDGGITWDHARPPPHHLVAAVPYQYNVSQLASGWGDPTNIVQHPHDGYYYHHDHDPDWNPADHICQVLEMDPAFLDPTQCGPFGLVWSPAQQVFLMTWGCLSGKGPFYVTTSTDLIHWSTPQAFYDRSMLPQSVQTQTTSLHYPSLLDPAAPTLLEDPNYANITNTPYLFWVSFGHSPYSDGRTVWATPLIIRNGTSPSRVEEDDGQSATTTG